jgi:hypothetical protein
VNRAKVPTNRRGVNGSQGLHGEYFFHRPSGEAEVPELRGLYPFTSTRVMKANSHNWNTSIHQNLCPPGRTESKEWFSEQEYFSIAIHMLRHLDGASLLEGHCIGRGFSGLDIDVKFGFVLTGVLKVWLV